MTMSNDSSAPLPSDEAGPAPEPLSTPETSTGIQSTPPAASATSETPASETAPTEPRAPKPSLLTPERMALEMARLDRGLVIVVLVLGYFLASFAAANSDFWRHLATGRAIARGDYQPSARTGTDPFSYTTRDVRWINHAWLFDLALYALSGTGGSGQPAFDGAVLVAIKAVVVTALAAILLLIRRPGQSLWIPTACVALGLVAMSPRLQLQPTFLSLFFLALTLYLLQRGARIDPASAGEDTLARDSHDRLFPSALWWLPVLFALWVNLDSWFLLGPLTVGLYLAGEVVQRFIRPGQQPEGAPRGDLVRLALVIVVGLAACLLNPFHVYAFTLPPEFVVATFPESVRADSLFHAFQSPLSPSFFMDPTAGFNPAGLAYYILVLAGVVSFALNGAQISCWRLLVWAVFFALSAWTAPFVPFFAVVAAPITALNFQDFAARRFGTTPRTDGYWKLGSLGGRLLTLAAGLALLAVAWPGWLHPRADDPRWTRRVAWRVWTDPSLRRAAVHLRGLQTSFRQDSLAPEDTRGFNSVPAIADYCAWFAPEERGFCDERFQLFRDVVPAYVEVRKALHPPGETGGPGALDFSDPAAWQKLLDAPGYRINHVTLSSDLRGETLPLLQRFWHDQVHWTWLYLDGRTTVFGWNGSRARASGTFQPDRLDLNRLAFGPNPPASAMSPSEMVKPPLPRGSWADYWAAPPSRPPGVDEAAIYLGYFSEVAAFWPDTYYGGRRVLALAGPAAAAGLGTGLLYAPPLVLMPIYTKQDAGPVAAPVLAVRAARRAVAASPENWSSYVALAKSLEQLWNDQQRQMGSAVPMLTQLRRAQIMTALRHATLLNPDAPEPHRMLAAEYRQMSAGNPPRPSHLDLAVEEQETWFKWFKEVALRRGDQETGVDFQNRSTEHDKQVKGIEDEINKMKDSLEERRNKFENEAFNKPPLQKARIALRYGLAQQALDVMNGLDRNQIGPEETSLILELLVSTGQMDKANPGEQGQDEWVNLLLSATAGDYRAADHSAERMLGQKEQTDLIALLNLVRGQAFQTIMSPESLLALGQVSAGPREWADLRVLRGLLMIEQGDTAAARQHFRQAMDLLLTPDQIAAAVAPATVPNPLDRAAAWRAWYEHAARARFDFSTRPLAARYLELMQAADRSEGASER